MLIRGDVDTGGLLQTGRGSSVRQFLRLWDFTECSPHPSTGTDELYEVWGGYGVGEEQGDGSDFATERASEDVAHATVKRQVIR
jgi:hypothetical protein